MRIAIGFFTGFIFLVGCSNLSSLKKEFGCDRNTISNTAPESDFFENFSVEIPKNWKKTFYYDDLQSEIFVADTTKIFEETYVMEFSTINGKMNSDEMFKTKVHEQAKAKGLKILKDNFLNFNNLSGYYNYGVGIHNNSEIHVFQYYIKINDTQYFMAKTEIYGNQNVEERLCDSFQIINSLKINKRKR